MRYFILIFLVFIVACANKPTHGSNILTKRFIEYKSFYKTKTESAFFNPSLWDSIEKARYNSNKSVFVDILSKFPNEIGRILDYKESIHDKTGCLLVSGINSENTPMDYYLTYELKNGKWIIGDMTMKYFFDGTERFLKEAVCSEEERAKLWLEFTENKE